MEYTEYVNRLFGKSAMNGIPLSGTFELTSRCNLSCKMCYIHRSENDARCACGELSGAQWLDIARSARDSGTLMLLLTGGEPLLRRDFSEIYRGCREMGMLVSVNTNATLVSDAILELFGELPPQRVNITLYGSTPETYERLCGCGSACERAYNAVSRLTDAEITVKLNFSATPYNLDELPAVERFAEKNGLVLQTAGYMFPPVRAEGAKTSCERLSPTEYAALRWRHERAVFGRDMLLRMAEATAGRMQLPPMRTECQELPTERIRCRAGQTTFWAAWNGEMRPCGMMNEPTFSIAEHGFSGAWSRVRKAREEIMVPADCTACSWRGICESCPAVCCAETGRFERKPEYMCRAMEAYAETAAQWLKSEQKAAESSEKQMLSDCKK